MSEVQRLPDAPPLDGLQDASVRIVAAKGDKTKAKWSTVFRDDRIVCRLDIRWELYPSYLPEDGDVWQFEAARWGAAGGQCWNGMESIHGRSTWGNLTDDLRSVYEKAYPVWVDIRLIVARLREEYLRRRL